MLAGTEESVMDDGEKMNEENFSLAGMGSNGSRKRLDRWTNISHATNGLLPPTLARTRETLMNGHSNGHSIMAPDDIRRAMPYAS
jgi:hypothetical protein